MVLALTDRPPTMPGGAPEGEIAGDFLGLRFRVGFQQNWNADDDAQILSFGKAG